MSVRPPTVWFHDGPRDEYPDPKLTVLNFSAGAQSSMLLWMVIHGDLPRPENFLVLSADPGMENSRTYEYRDMMFSRARALGIDCFVAPGPNLYTDLLSWAESDRTRMDNPPYWVHKGDREDGTKKIGRLQQKCTREYKVAPMDRFIRQYMQERLGVSAVSKRIGEGIVEKWIGFAADEFRRVDTPRVKYQRFRFPLIDLNMDRAAIIAQYEKYGVPRPPRSVCNACFANGLNTLRSMYEERPEDWQQAVQVDQAVRDMQRMGVKHPVYVSQSCVPLTELPGRNFLQQEKDADELSCDSGYCFT